MNEHGRAPGVPCTHSAQVVSASIFNAVYGPGAQVGVLLPNSRNQELEADHYGLIFAAMAGLRYFPGRSTRWPRGALPGSAMGRPRLFNPAGAGGVCSGRMCCPT